MEGAQPLRYSRQFLLALQESPLVKKPDDLPAIETLLAKTESPRKDVESRSRATAEGNEDSSPARPSRLGERGMVFGPPKMNFVSTRTAAATTSESSAPRSLRRGSAVEEDGSGQEPRRRAPLVVGPSSSSTFPRAPRYSAEEKFAKGPTRAPREPGASDKLPVAPTKGGDKGPKTTQMQPLPPPVDHGDGGPGRRPKLRAEQDDDGKHARSDERSSAARKTDLEYEKPGDRQPAWMSYDINDKAHMNLAASDGLDDIQRFKLEMSKKTNLTKESPKEAASSPKIDHEALEPAPQTPVAKDDGPNVLDAFIAKERGLTEVPLRLASTSDSQAGPAGARMPSDTRAVSRFQQLFSKEIGPQEGIQVERSFQDFNQGRVPQGVPANTPFRPSLEEAFGARGPRSENMLSVLLPNVGNNPPRHVDGSRMVPQGAPREFFETVAQPPVDNEVITKSILDTLKGKGNSQGVGLPVGQLPPGAKVYTESEILRMHGVDAGPLPPEDRRGPPVARRLEMEGVQPQQRPDDPTTIFSGRRFPRPEVQGGDSGEMKRIMGMLAQSSIQVQGADRYEAMLAAQAQAQVQAQPPRFSQNPAYGRPGVPMQMGGMNQPPYGNPPAGYGPGGPGPMMSRPVMVPRPGPAFLQLQQQEQQLQQQQLQHQQQLQLQQLQRQQLQQQQLQQHQQQQRAQMGPPPAGFFGSGALPPDVAASLPFHHQLRGPSPPLPGAGGGGAAGPYGRPPPQYFQPNPNDLAQHQHGYGGPGPAGGAPRAGSVRLDDAAMAGLVQAGGGGPRKASAPTPPHGLPTHEMMYKGGLQQGEPPMMGGPNGIPGQPSQVRLDDMPFGPPPGGYFQSPLVGNGGGGGNGLPPFYRQ